MEEPGDYYLLQLGVCPVFSNLKFSMRFTFLDVFSHQNLNFCVINLEDIIILLIFLVFFKL